MYIFEKYLYFMSFEAGNCVSNSSFRRRKIQLKQFSRTTVNPILLNVFFLSLVPESPRWLLSRNRDAEAKAIIIRMAKVNKARLPEDLNLRPDVIQPDKVVVIRLYVHHTLS